MNDTYFEIKSYLKQVANDPDSIEMVKCTTAKWGNQLGWSTDCIFRGKNAFGATILSSKTFYISKDRVISL